MQETTASTFASTFAGDSQAKAPRQTYALSFSGSGSEYFKIWIVNVLLSIVTLGVYSAWAKVRRLQYFYRNTQLAGASFDYHGEPKAILKGRALAFLLMLVYAVAGKVNPLLGVVLFLLLSVLTPYLLVRSLRFNLSNTSYRGLRFNFVGDQKGAARVFLFYPLLSMLSLGLALPWVNQRTREYMVTHCQYGTRAFRFKATVGDYYRLYLRVVLPIVLILLAAGALVWRLSGGNWMLVLVFGYLALYALIAVFGLLAVYVRMKLFNLSWNATRLREHRFYSRLEAGPYLWIKISNVLAIICTLGLFIPFAAVRTARYRVEHMGLKTRGDLEAFVAGEVAKSAALGEELADMMDLDFAL